jgi:DNA (cytosine-5)-methyltransferase 1
MVVVPDVAGGKPGQGVPAIHVESIQSFQTRIARNGRGYSGEIVGALVSAESGSHGDSRPHVFGPCGVRRLMPLEEERCQGMPDDWTRYGVTEDGKEVELSDSARYRLIGNSVAIPCVEWIAKRIVV